MLVKNSPAVHAALGVFWASVLQHTAFGRDYVPRCAPVGPDSLFTTPLPPLSRGAGSGGRGESSDSRGDGECGVGLFSKEMARGLQRQLVLLFHDYTFAVEAWGLLIGQCTSCFRMYISLLL